MFKPTQIPFHRLDDNSTSAEVSLPVCSLAIFERSLGGFHPNVAVLLVNMAQLYLSQGIYKDAKLLYERALVIKAKMLGADHPETTKLQSNLAAVSSAMSTSEVLFLLL